jgi:hypothetical protein
MIKTADLIVDLDPEGGDAGRSSTAAARRSGPPGRSKITPRASVQPAIEIECFWLWPVLVAPATPITIITVGPLVAVIPVPIGAVVIPRAIVTPMAIVMAAVIVADLLDRRVRHGGTIERDRGHGRAGLAGARE